MILLSYYRLNVFSDFLAAIQHRIGILFQVSPAFKHMVQRHAMAQRHSGS